MEKFLGEREIYFRVERVCQASFSFRQKRTCLFFSFFLEIENESKSLKVVQNMFVKETMGMIQNRNEGRNIEERGLLID